MLHFLNIFVVVLGVAVTALGAYQLVRWPSLDYVKIGTTVGGFLTFVIGIIAFCGRKSGLIMGCYIFFTLILFIAYVGVTVLYFLNYVCDNPSEKDTCEEFKDFIMYAKYGFLGVDVLMVNSFNINC
jgi:hypothetical protein